ncbi:MAG: NAD(P)-dependent oxidoreductase, partial [Myxococcaceae bacterium]
CEPQAQKLLSPMRTLVAHPETLCASLWRMKVVSRLTAAALDVMTPEPLPTNHSLLDVPHLLLPPHIASTNPCACG